MQLSTLYEGKRRGVTCLTPELERLYGGELSFPEPSAERPYVIGNFVETLDGVVTYDIPGKSGGGTISGCSEEDRFIMGLLRSVSDAVVIGSGTLPGDIRVPGLIYPPAKDLYAAVRKKLGKPPLPLNVVLTASGRVDLHEPTFQMERLPSLIITTEEGAERLRSRGDASYAVIRSTGEKVRTTPAKVLRMLYDDFGVRLLLHEGGPTVFGQYVADGKIDELFLTLAPQIAGSQSEPKRPSMAGASVFVPETAPWWSLQSVKRGTNVLLLRYSLQRQR